MPGSPYPLNTLRKTLRVTEVQYQPQGHTGGMGQRWDLNLRTSDSLTPAVGCAPEAWKHLWYQRMLLWVAFPGLHPCFSSWLHLPE